MLSRRCQLQISSGALCRVALVRNFTFRRTYCLHLHGVSVYSFPQLYYGGNTEPLHRDILFMVEENFLLETNRENPM
jgi:hypothetical protein